MTVAKTAAIYKLVVNEIFGPTFQGEGPAIGRPCGFIRLTGCNLHCRWCDSAYTWRFNDRHPHDFAGVFDQKAESHSMFPDDILPKIVAMNVPMVVLTGGEPLLQQYKPAFYELLFSLQELGIEVHVETNGTRAPADRIAPLVKQFSVSPKLNNSGNSRDERIAWHVLDTFVGMPNAIFKFVAATDYDLEEIATICTQAKIPNDRVYIMPLGVTEEAINVSTALVAETAVLHGWNLTTRLHILVFGDKRGT
jgi:7-carboxy-7-deazaguanine synthase